MSEQNNYFYNNEGADNNVYQYYQQPMPQPEPPKKKHTALKVIGIVFGVLVFIFVVLMIIGIVTDDTDYDDYGEDTSQNEIFGEEDRRTEKDILGTFTEDSYINEFAQLKFSLPSDDWTFKRGDELYEIYKNNGETDDNGNVIIRQSDNLYYYDMLAMDNTNGTTVELVVTRIASDSIYSRTTEDMFLNNSLAVLDDVDTGKIYDVSIGGENYRAVDIRYKNIDLGLNQLMAVRKVNGEFIVITIEGYAKVDDNELSYYIDFFEKA